MDTTSIRDRLRTVRVFGGELPQFDVEAAPADPLDLFVEWLEAAIDAGVSQPQAMVLATAASDGPNARTLLLKDVTSEGFWFSSLAESPKGRELEADPRATLVLYWREQGRQVRVWGTVRPGPVEVSRADFVSRHPNARATAIASQQSEVMPGDEAAAALVAEARAVVDADPSFVPASWTAYVLEPTVVEFWQAERARDQVRLRYSRGDGEWMRDRLWP